MLRGLTLFLAGCGGEPVTEEMRHDGDLPSEAPAAAPRLPAPPDPAPPLTLVDAATGRPWSLDGAVDPVGDSCPRAVLVAFLAADCAPCQESLPVLRALEVDHPELEVVVALVDADPDARDRQLAAVRAAGIDGAAGAVDEDALAAWTGPKTAPLLVFVDRWGTLVSRNPRFDDIVRDWLPKQAALAIRRGGFTPPGRPAPRPGSTAGGTPR